MLTTFQWISFFCILIVAFLGGFFPLFKQEKAKKIGSFANGEAFSAGVFIALALTMMLPSAFHLLSKGMAHVNYPVAPFVAALAFIFLLMLEHLTGHIESKQEITESELTSPIIPIIMTIMIAIPSFFLGTALGVSGTEQAVIIFIAIIIHKGSAGFALALKMVRSTMTKNQTFIVFTLFAFSTPIGIIVGEDMHKLISGEAMFVIKGSVLSLAAGTFLYMGTLHEMQDTPLIKRCSNVKGFLLMLSGFLITAFVRFLIGEAHKF